MTERPFGEPAPPTYKNSFTCQQTLMKRFLSLAFSVFLLAASLAPVRAQQTGHNFEVAKNLDIFNALYRELDLYYVDTLDAKKNIDNALLYMLEQIDPYTEYYAEENTEKLRQMTTGKYGGIGSMIRYKRSADRCIIEQPGEGMPAALAGLRPGDIILAIDGKEIAPCGKQDSAAYASMVSGKLRGEPGTSLELKVRRPGTGRTLTAQLTRRKIVMPSVSLYTMVGDSVGYIKVGQFIEDTASEIRRAIAELKGRGARRLVLDLRNNPGGLVEEAVKTVNLFIPRGRVALNIKGKVKEANHTYKTTIDPLDPDIPLAVLTDSYSASAAEITSGVLQDYDRAVIIGQRTYGKGLVQQSRELPYKAVVKLTTGKYYIPSGRCVQAYSFKDGMPVHLADTLAKDFQTAAGRIVKDGGGITPDITVKTDSLPRLIYYLTANDLLFDYAVNYRNTHDSIAPPSQFRLSEQEYADFCAYLRKNGFSYDRQSLQALDRLRKVARIEGYETEAKEELDALEAKLKHNEKQDFSRWEKEIRAVVETIIVNNFYYTRGADEYELRDDHCLEKALQILCNDKEYRKLLSGEPEP